jgi:lipoprotein-releasing system ATP-binding protein
MIKVSQLHKDYGVSKNPIHVLRDVDLEIGIGERVGIVGSSGAGKTTLMNILGGLDRPTSGKVEVDGRNLFSMAPAEMDSFRNREMGFVFQFNQLLPEFSALENVMMPALIARLSGPEARSRATDLLAEVGLSHRLEHKPGQLSGGEQQRVAIARALVMQPRFLLADEPTGNLDSGTSDAIYHLFQRLHATRDLTIIIVTHNDQLASRLDRVVKMEDGCIVGV